jgi:hypothetical protein
MAQIWGRAACYTRTSGHLEQYKGAQQWDGTCVNIHDDVSQRINILCCSWKNKKEISI